MTHPQASQSAEDIVKVRDYLQELAIFYHEKSSDAVAAREALAALNRLAAAFHARAGEWLPIETAPKDGFTHILAYPVLLDRASVVIWEKPARTPPMMRLVSNERHDHDGYWRIAMSVERSPYQPLFWQPLPAPPASAERDGGEG